MSSVVVEIARPPDEVWSAFTNARLFSAWMPGLRRATVVAEQPDGLPTEVLFEYSTSLVYSLTYAYDVAKREVRWAPRVGIRDGVSGSARIEAIDGGSQISYELAQGTARNAGELVLGGPHVVVSAFVRWIENR